MTTETVPADVRVIQADRRAAADFVQTAWHLFWPHDFKRAMADADDIVAGRCDNWTTVQAFARHRLATAPALEAIRDEPAVREGMVLARDILAVRAGVANHMDALAKIHTLARDFIARAEKR